MSQIEHYFKPFGETSASTREPAAAAFFPGVPPEGEDFRAGMRELP